MVCKLHCAFFFATAPLILGLKLQVDGKMDFGPKWSYEYRIKPLETETDEPIRTFTSMDKKPVFARVHTQPKFIDIIIRNNKSNPRLVQVAEAHIFDRKDKNPSNLMDGVINLLKPNNRDFEKHKAVRDNKNSTVKVRETTPFKFSDEHTMQLSDEHKDAPDKPSEDDLTKAGKYVRHIVRYVDDIDAPKPFKLEETAKSPVAEEKGSYRATLMTFGHKKKKERHRTVKEDETTTRLVIPAVTDVKSPVDNSERLTTKWNAERLRSVSWSPWWAVTDLTTEQNSNMYIEPRQVKDDPKIKEFMRHLYDQSMKTLDEIKTRIDNYAIKDEVNHLKRSYEDKFGEFVKETQNHNIKTRLGNRKVILNTLDTSNRIMDRLVNYMIGKMNTNKILRSTGIKNEIVKDLNKKKELENRHLCVKMQICPTSDSYTKFLVDILNTVLRSPDNKIIQIRDAWTEVLKNTDFSELLEADTEKHLLRAINELEKYNIHTVRPIFFIMKNILSSKNSPIKVVGSEDNRVNKTIAFLEILDYWDKKIPPNEQNMLEWNDMRNSFEEWRAGKREDTLDLMQHFTDLAIRAMSESDAKFFDRNVNTILGY